MNKQKDWRDLTLEEINKRLYNLPREEWPGVLEYLSHDSRKGVQNLVVRVKRELENEQRERMRLANMWELENRLKEKGFKAIGGIDEAGRGPLAGPVVAACVILPAECHLPGLNDSKKLSPQERQKLALLIKEQATAWAVGLADHGEIDRINILQATKKAMQEAVGKMPRQPDYLLIDALRLPLAIPQEGIIHGDSISACIAAASILAKTYRDELMDMLHELYPLYGFNEHKGYGTPRHLAALELYGACPVHRTTFISHIVKTG